MIGGSSTYTDPESVEKIPSSVQKQPMTNIAQVDNPQGHNNNIQNENRPTDNEQNSNCINDESKHKNCGRETNNQIQGEKHDIMGHNEQVDITMIRQFMKNSEMRYRMGVGW
ncbi:unnamed protein product [Owenia fusiformis]|uniref:Uncharacterized protein n=1 Tax=Owenia fusiformis TaxID=6347 RepID=A0A8S4P0E5_OWEFU|nr:unnamed protein product [Owenia fusiformis]